MSLKYEKSLRVPRSLAHDAVQFRISYQPMLTAYCFTDCRLFEICINIKSTNIYIYFYALLVHFYIKSLWEYSGGNSMGSLEVIKHKLYRISSTQLLYCGRIRLPKKYV